MPQAQLFFLNDQYYLDFPDDKLMKNKDTIDGVPHSRPCFFAFPDARRPEIYWIVPIRPNLKSTSVSSRKKSRNMAGATRSALERSLGGTQPF